MPINDNSKTEFPDIARASLERFAQSLAASKGIKVTDQACKLVIDNALSHPVSPIGASFPGLDISGEAVRRINDYYALGDIILELFDQAVLAAQPISMPNLLREAFRKADLAAGRPSRLLFPEADAIEAGLKGWPRDFPCLSVQETLEGDIVILYHTEHSIHRDYRDGPAYLVAKPDNTILREYFFSDGLLHRPPKLGPAARILTRDHEITRYCLNGVLHRDEDDGPAFSVRDQATGKPLNEEWFCEGKLHRLGGPACIDAQYKEEWEPENRRVRREGWFWHGQIHRSSRQGPAVTDYDATGRKIREIYVEDGKRHRDPASGPAEILWSAEGEETSASYCVRGQLHREDGPAFTWHPSDWAEEITEYHLEGNLHRNPLEGPARIVRARDGSRNYEEFWSNGERIEPPS
ncbi:hypothetical protein [Rhodovulum sp. PH10]|uniref:hypothetical protein n=1 Tax=Rhodovulum sp. PH10 TaxID=1187851 RepID=UPI00058EAB21|nr:hypothetical protein [Rhodovulum sp. PH10]